MSDFKQIQLRRDVSSDWAAINPILASGEPGLETNTNKLKLGDGVTAWNDLPYLTQGVKGDKGDRGYQGTAGLKGDPGNDGAPGATGQTGLPGSTGATGAKGDKGDTGAAGANGSNGAKGEKGDKGDTGDPGANGTNGTNGTNGADGLDGVIQSIVGGSGITVDDTDPANPIIETSGAVTSVNGDTGDVVLNQDDVLDGTTYKQYSATEKTKLAGIETAADVTDAANVGAAGAFMKSVDDTDDITIGATNKFATAAEKTKLGHITVTQAVDLDTMESDIAAKQPLDADLTTIAALDSSVAGALVTDGSGWIKKTYAQLKTALGLVKGDVGLGNVDNTSDANKPVSTAQQTAIDAKVADAINDGTTTIAPSQNAVFDALALKQALDADLTSWAAITRAAGFDTFVATPSGANLAAALTSALPASKGGTGLTALSANIISLLGAADYAAVRTLLGLVIGTNVQAYDADLSTIAGLTATTDNFLQAKSSAWASRTPAQVAADLSVEVGKLLYPVGCIYTSVNSTNPATSLGFGTWSAFGAGRVPVGFDSGQTEFDTDEETGGAKTVAGASHTHALSDSGYAQASVFNSGGNSFIDARTVSATTFTSSNGLSTAGTRTSISSTLGIPLRGATDSTAAAATSVLQPYIVVRMWKRTA